MNSMIKAIYQQKNIIQVDDNHTWKKLNMEKKCKDIYLFGAGVQCLYFLERYRNKYAIKGIFDNSYLKYEYGVYGIKVMNPQKLVALDKENSIIVITSTNYYTAICSQLEQNGFKNYYILFNMEAQKLSNRWKVFLYSLFRNYYDNIHRKHKLNYSERMEIGHREAPIQNNKIVFFSYGKYSDHAKYLSEYAYKMGYNWDLVWVLDDDVICPDYVRRISSEKRQAVVYEMATAKIWITTAELPPYAVKRKGQYCIQTKHWSSITLKKFYLDTSIYFRKNRMAKKSLKAAISLYDYIVIGSKFDEKTCRSGYRYHKKFLRVGSPRTDILINHEISKPDICNKLKINHQKNIILYAPTFRVQDQGEKVTEIVNNCMPDFECLKKSVEDKFGNECMVLLRLHPHIAKEYVGIFENTLKNAVDVSLYPDIQELIAVADIVITDYSSLMFEPAMVGKIVMLYAPDYTDYVKNERELWFDLEELPFPLACSDSQLAENISQFSMEQYRSDVELFLDKYGVHEDGKACERTVQEIEKLMLKGNVK